jgi:hypothetical protein
MFSESKGADGEYLAIGLTENLETGVRQCLGDNSDPDIDRIVLDQGGEVLDLGPREPAPGMLQPLREQGIANHPVAGEPLDFQRRHQVEDSRLACAIGRLSFS